MLRQLLAAGVHIHEWSGSVLDAKAATVDERRLLVDSFNLDPVSLANKEALVEVDDTSVVEQGEAWSQDHVSRSRSMTSVEASSWLHRWMLDPVGRLGAQRADAIGRVIASGRQRKAALDYSRSSRNEVATNRVVGGGASQQQVGSDSAVSP